MVILIYGWVQEGSMSYLEKLFDKCNYSLIFDYVTCVKNIIYNIMGL